MSLAGPYNSGAATGGAGVATANTTHSSGKSGSLLAAVYVKYNLTPPAATTDVIITTTGKTANAPVLTLLTITNAATDGWWFPRTLEHLNTDGTALTSHTYLPIEDSVNVKIQGANDVDNVDVWLLVI